MPAGVKGFEKGHPGFKKPGTKNRDTLLKEERRAIFEAKVSQKWEETIDKLPPQYIADQFMGAVTQKREISVDKLVELPEAKIEAINEIMLDDDREGSS